VAGPARPPAQAPPPPEPLALEEDWSDLSGPAELPPAPPAPPRPEEPRRASGDSAIRGLPRDSVPLALELPQAEMEEGEPEAPPLAAVHEFVPAAETTGHRAEPPAPADGGEAQLREALPKASREVIERIAWEVVPQLAEAIIRERLADPAVREQLERLAKERH